MWLELGVPVPRLVPRVLQSGLQRALAAVFPACAAQVFHMKANHVKKKTTISLL